MSALLRLTQLKIVSSKDETTKLSSITSLLKTHLEKKGFNQDQYDCYIDDAREICVAFYNNILRIFVEPVPGGFNVSTHTVVYHPPNFKVDIKKYGTIDLKTLEKLMPVPMPKKSMAELLKKPEFLASAGYPCG